MPEQPKITKRQIAPSMSDKRIDSGLSCRPSSPKYCFTTNPNKPRTDQYLESTLVNNIGIIKPLTKRETQILRSILDGKTNKQIALMLSRSCRTIEYHRSRLMRKLNAHNTAELVKRAVAMGIG